MLHILYILLYCAYYNIILSWTTIVYAVRCWGQRRYAAHTCTSLPCLPPARTSVHWENDISKRDQYI